MLSNAEYDEILILKCSKCFRLLACMLVSAKHIGMVDCVGYFKDYDDYVLKVKEIK